MREGRKSLVLITVDCLRADHVGFGGYERSTTPFLDSLSAESFVFKNAIVGGTPTYYSFPSIMASRHPLALGRDVVGLAPGEATLATILKQSGYATGAFLAGNPYLSPRFGYHESFDVFHDFLDTKSDSVPDKNDRDSGRRLRRRVNRGLERFSRQFAPLGALYQELYFEYCQRKLPAVSLDGLRRFPSGDVLVDQASAWLESLDGMPFFLWLHFMDPHAPYYPPQKAMEEMGGMTDANQARYLNSYWNRSDLAPRRLAKHRKEVIALYDAGIRWVDVQLSRLVEWLQQHGVWDGCTLVITGDHGEEFLEHGGRYHSPSKVCEELIRVPLLLRVPNIKPNFVRSALSLVDLAPTVVQALCASPPRSFRGKSRWREMQENQDWDEAAVVECVGGCTNPFLAQSRMGARIMAVREQRYKLVIDFKSSGEQLFDLEADPRELNPLSAGTEPEIRRRLLKIAGQHITDSLESREVGRQLAARLHNPGQPWDHPVIGISA